MTIIRLKRVMKSLSICVKVFFCHFCLKANHLFISYHFNLEPPESNVWKYVLLVCFICTAFIIVVIIFFICCCKCRKTNDDHYTFYLFIYLYFSFMFFHLYFCIFICLFLHFLYFYMV